MILKMLWNQTANQLSESIKNARFLGKKNLEGKIEIQRLSNSRYSTF